MVERDLTHRRFDAVAETVGEQTAETLELLSNETRLEIIVALWDAIDRKPNRAQEDESGLLFSELFDRVEVEDSGRFTYHLDKLTDRFVDHSDGTYTLTKSAWRILSTVIAGAATDTPSFGDEPVDTDCFVCGGSVIIDYNDGILSLRCTNCEGIFRGPDDPPGLLMTHSRSPAGLTNRSPQEFFRQGNVDFRHDVLSYLEGVCPNCTGSVTATAHVCENHDPGEYSLCPHCRQLNKIGWNCVCDVCKSRYGTDGWAPILTETAVVTFFYERGVDIREAFDTQTWGDVLEAVDATVSARDLLEVTVTAELDGDCLTVTLDDDANVMDIEKSSG